MGLPGPSSARTLITTVVLVAAMFAASLGLSEVRLARIDVDVQVVNENATPAMEHLDRARSELMSLGISVPRYLFGPADGRTAAEEEIRSSLWRLRDELAAYRSIPFLPGEAPKADRMLDDLVVTEASIADLLAPDRPGPREAFETFAERWIAMDRALDGLVDLNTEAVRARIVEIERSRNRAARTALVLGLISITGTALATVQAVRTLRAQTALRAELVSLLESRATELEAFAGRVAHDLRDPVSAMALRLAVARRCPPAELETSLFVPLSRQLTGMSRSIDALLSFARSGGRPAPDERAELAETVRDVVTDLEPLARASGVELRVEELPPTEVACDRGALRSVLGNLVHNSIRYLDGEERRVTIAASADGGAVRVTVSDTGPGIPAGSEERIFVPFVRLAPAVDDRGTGLGLATVKKIVEAHGGRVGVESTPGRGARFWFVLPVAGSSGGSAPVDPTVPGDRAGEGRAARSSGS